MTTLKEAFEWFLLRLPSQVREFGLFFDTNRFTIEKYGWCDSLVFLLSKRLKFRIILAASESHLLKAARMKPDATILHLKI